jgi:outer membrane lipoprotein-sorting protein
MNAIQRGCLVLASVLLAACGSADDGSKRAEPPPVEETVFGDMAGTMDKARAVESTMQQHTESLNRTMEQSESARSSDDQ